MSTQPIEQLPLEKKPAWNEIVRALDDATMRFVTQLTLDPSSMSHFTTWLTHETTSTRYELYNTPDEVVTAWNAIDKAGAVIIDYVTDVTAAMLLEISFHGEKYRANFFEGMARALSQFGDAGAWSAVKSSEERERWLTYDDAKLMLEANPWVAALYMVRRTEYMAMLVAMTLKFRQQHVPTEGAANA